MTTRGMMACGALTLVAGGTGLLVGLLMAPASGRDTRRRWLRRAEEEMDVLERKSRRAIEAATREAQHYVGERAERVKEHVSDLVTP